MARSAVLLVCLAFVCFGAFVTVTSAIKNGVNGFEIVSLAILAVVGFGVIGALTTPSPPED